MNEWMNAVININPAVFVMNYGRKFKPNIHTFCDVTPGEPRISQ